MKRDSTAPVALSFSPRLAYSLPVGSSSRIFTGSPAGGACQPSVRTTVLV